MNKDLDTIHRFLDGEVSEAEKKDFLNRVNREPFLKEEFDELHRAVCFVEDSEKLAAPPHFTASVMRKLPASQKSFKAILRDFLFKGRMIRWNMATVLTTACLMLVIWGGTLQLFKNHDLVSPVNISTSPGGVTVRLTFYAPGAKKVAIAGDFNKWKIDGKGLRKQGDGNWVAEIHLKPGAYDYMFVVDGKNWVADPNAELYHDDGFGDKNSVLRVAQL